MGERVKVTGRQGDRQGNRLIDIRHARGRGSACKQELAQALAFEFERARERSKFNLTKQKKVAFFWKAMSVYQLGIGILRKVKVCYLLFFFCG